MYLKYIDNNKYINKIEELYLNSFPEDERFPFWILEKSSKENNSDLYAIIDNNKFVGMCYIVNCTNAYYLMYLAVEPSLRNQKYGSKILIDLKEKYKTLFLSVDTPIDDISVRRKNFYLKNGFYDTNKFYEDTNVNYEVLCTDYEYEITDDIMKTRYTNMTNNSKLFEVISNVFNVNVVNLRDKSKGSDKMNENKTNINWYPGHMAKTKREIGEKLNLIDIVFEVIDSRIPLSSKNHEIAKMIGNKPRILVMTKVDLCDESITLKWKKFYEEQGYHVALVDLLHDKNLNEVLNITNQLAKEVNDKRTSKGLKPRRVRILILGIPNVGKSTLINRLVGKKATNVGNRPGVTKSLEWIRVNKDLELLDTPGILWPKLEGENIALNLASMTAIKEEILNKESVAIYIIKTMLEKYPNQLIDRYNLKRHDDIVEILDDIGTKIGATKNGETDYEKVYTIILKDLREGHLGKVTFDTYEN